MKSCDNNFFFLLLIGRYNVHSKRQAIIMMMSNIKKNKPVATHTIDKFIDSCFNTRTFYFLFNYNNNKILVDIIFVLTRNVALELHTRHDHDHRVLCSVVIVDTKIYRLVYVQILYYY